MWIWFAIPLGVGIIGALLVISRRSSTEGIYVGIVERDLAVDDTLQVRAYVDETLVHELPEPSKLTGRMFIRETSASVPLKFLRVPPYVPQKVEPSDGWQERAVVPFLPVIVRFDPVPGLALHPGQLVDVYIAEP